MANESAESKSNEGPGNESMIRNLGIVVIILKMAKVPF